MASLRWYATRKADFDLIEVYNKDDCIATYKLHEWLEIIYQNQIKNGSPLERPEIKTGEASDTRATQCLEDQD